MNSEVPPSLPESTRSTQVTVPSERDLSPSRLRRVCLAPVKFLWGMAFCQSVLGSLAVLGWTYRLMQRSVLKGWWEQSGMAGGHLSFSNYVAGDPRTQEHLHWPNWFLQQNFRDAVRRDQAHGAARLLTVLKALGHSLWTNVRIGVQAIFNTWVFTLPACVLWLFAWYAGWGNSFNKGYEQAWIGPATGLVGIALFIGAMLYVPMAQARQAVTGQWKRFYDFRLIWMLMRRRWPACLGLAMLYSICSVPIVVLVSTVMFLPQINPQLGALSSERAAAVLQSYFFWSAAFVFPAFVFLHCVAARIYGSTLLKAVQTGAIGEEILGEAEWRTLHRLNLLQIQPERYRHPVMRAIAWAGTRAGRITFGFASGLVWFTFVAQIFISQFFNYVGAPGWLNQPLVQLPWFHHVPDALQNPWGDILLAALVVFVCWRLKKLVLWAKSLRAPRRFQDGNKNPRQPSPAVSD